MWLFFRHQNYYKKCIYIHFFASSIRLSRKNINFDNEKIKKCNFYKNKKLFTIYDIDVNRILISKKEPLNSKKGKKCSFLYFIGFNDDDDY